MRPKSRWYLFAAHHTGAVAFLLSVLWLSQPSPVLAQQPRVAFVTSIQGTADLGSWPDAGSEVGAAAGDAICRARATAAGLANPESFVAWLSTSTDDAYCRLHGLTGTKAANCGEVELPVNAGPWMRADGLPFSESIDQLLAPESVVYYLLEVDEFGVTIDLNDLSIFTLTTESGELGFGSNCGEWADTPVESTRGGLGYYGSNGWTTALTSISCQSEARLYCFERTAGPPLPPRPAAGAVAFVTSVAGQGDLGAWPDAGGETGIAAGDAICQARAAAGGLERPDEFKAWLSDSTTHAIERFEDPGARIRPDGVRIADSLADLTDGKLDATLNVDELGNYIGNSAAWTGTNASGQLLGSACADWASASDTQQGRAGSVWNSSGNWTQVFSFDCDGFDRLYCIADPAPVFVDGFESGDLAAWTSTTP